MIEGTQELNDGDVIEYRAGEAKVRAEITTRPHIDKSKGFKYSRVPILRIGEVNARGYRIKADTQDYDLETLGAVVDRRPNAPSTRVYTRIR